MKNKKERNANQKPLASVQSVRMLPTRALSRFGLRKGAALSSSSSTFGVAEWSLFFLSEGLCMRATTGMALTTVRLGVSEGAIVNMDELMPPVTAAVTMMRGLGKRVPWYDVMVKRSCVGR